MVDLVGALGRAQWHAILRAAGPGQTRLHFIEVQFHDRAVVRTACAVGTPQSGGLGVGLDQRDLFWRPARKAQVPQRFLVNREDRAGAAEFRRHVADRGAVGERQIGQPIAKEFDELVHYALPAQHLGDREHEIGGGSSSPQAAAEPEADHFRNQHRDRLSEHGGFRLNAAYAPAQHAQTIDHRSVRVRANQGIRISLAHAIAGDVKHDAAQELQVDLVHDAGVRRHHFEIAERALAPAQERVALAVAFELDAIVGCQCLGGAVFVHLYGMVDDQLGGRQRIDLLGVAAESRDGFTHRGQVDHAGDAGKILHDHAGGSEGNLVRGLRLGIPVEERLDVGTGHIDAVFKAQQILQQDLQGIGQARHALGAQRRDIVNLVVRAGEIECRARLKTVSHARLHCGIGLGGTPQPVIIRIPQSRRRPGSVRADISPRSALV